MADVLVCVASDYIRIEFHRRALPFNCIKDEFIFPLRAVFGPRGAGRGGLVPNYGRPVGPPPNHSESLPQLVEAINVTEDVGMSLLFSEAVGLGREGPHKLRPLFVRVSVAMRSRCPPPRIPELICPDAVGRIGQNYVELAWRLLPHPLN